MARLYRITQLPDKTGDNARIRGMLVGQFGVGQSVDDPLVDYPYLAREDIMQARRYAAWRAEQREAVLASA